MATVTVPQALDLARQYLEAGRLAEAEGVLRQVLAKEPRNAEGMHLLGVVAHRAGRNDVAADLVRQAVVLDPISAQYRNTMGVVRHALGQLDEAVAEFRCALQIEPGLVQAHNNLGNGLRAKGQLPDAVAAYREALRRRPDYAEARNNLANALRETGQPAVAIEEYRTVLAAFPDSAPVHNNLGAALGDLGQHEAAVAAFRAALSLSPVFPQAHFNLGNTLRTLGQFSAAAEAYRGALAAQPDFAAGHVALSVTLRAAGDLPEAIASAERALRLRPDLAEAHNALGNALQESHQPAAAAAAFRAALTREPTFSEACNNLANALKDQGDIAGALDCYRRGLAHSPDDAAMHSNLVYSMLFDPAADWASLHAECERWDRQHAASWRASVAPHRNAPDPDRRLKVGYVSPDFWAQAECFFVLPLLEAHAHADFEIVCYADNTPADEVTERYRQCADRWCDTRGLGDGQLAEQIRQDGIDILVDLTMHMRRNRLLVFARQPAPVQVSWLAYPGSTGLPTIGHRLTDAIMEPVGAGSSGDEALRLPGCWCCYEAVGGAPEISPLPALATGAITFGSLNNPCKLNEPVLRRWAAVLHAVRDSRLLLLCPEGAARDRVLAVLCAQGLAPERVAFVSSQPRLDYLKLYERIDIGLDPFPYNGITTTCDALWMGVPVLTVPGATPPSRAGASLLSAAGLADEWVAQTEADHTQLAAALAADLPRLAALRSSLRERVRTSRLTDARRFAGEVETVFRSIWRRWCASSTR